MAQRLENPAARHLHNFIIKMLQSQTVIELRKNLHALLLSFPMLARLAFFSGPVEQG